MITRELQELIENNQKTATHLILPKWIVDKAIEEGLIIKTNEHTYYTEDKTLSPYLGSRVVLIDTPIDDNMSITPPKPKQKNITKELNKTRREFLKRGRKND